MKLKRPAGKGKKTRRAKVRAKGKKIVVLKSVLMKPKGKEHIGEMSFVISAGKGYF